MKIPPASDKYSSCLASQPRWMPSIAVIFSLWFVVAISCSDDHARERVTLYVSADEHVASQVIDRFEEKTGIEVLVVGDTELKKTSGLFDRIRRESAKPKADVFWNSEAFMTESLAAEGLLDAHHSAITEVWPEEHRHPDHLWHGFAGRARALVYNQSDLSAADVPAHWTDLADDEYAGKIVMADPRFGTTGGHLAVMQQLFDGVEQGGYRRFIEGLAANQVQMLPSGNAGVVDAVLRGEASLGLTDTDDVWAVLENGGEVGWTLPGHGYDENGRPYGPLIIPNTVALIRDGPHPQQAAMLADFLLSPEVEQLLAASASRNIPLGMEAAVENGISVVNPLDVDYAAAAAARSAAVQIAVERLGDS